MKKIFLILMIVLLAVMLAACETTNDSIQARNAETANADIDVKEETVIVKVDTTQDGSADGAVEMAKDEPVEVTIDFDEVQDAKTKEALADAARNVDYCVPGSIYNFDESGISANTIIIGVTMYKGSEFCQAQSSSVIETPVGNINSETTYYFDKTYTEYWVMTSVSGGPTPATTTEVHIVDGEVQVI